MAKLQSSGIFTIGVREALLLEFKPPAVALGYFFENGPRHAVWQRGADAKSAHRRHRSITGLTIYREAWAWGARLTTSTRRFSGAFKSDGFFGLVLP